MALLAQRLFNLIDLKPIYWSPKKKRRWQLGPAAKTKKDDMSYQFDASTLRPQSAVKVNGETASVRLLTRRTMRQNRRALRAI